MRVPLHGVDECRWVECPYHTTARAEALPTREQPATETGILPCPFCGEWLHLSHIWNHRSDPPTYQMACENCGGCGPTTIHDDTEIAYLRWNQRVPLTPSPSTKPQAPVSGANAQTVAQTGSEPNHEANAGGATAKQIDQHQCLAFKFHGMIEATVRRALQARDITEDQNVVTACNEAFDWFYKNVNPASLPSPTTEQKEKP